MTIFQKLAVLVRFCEWILTSFSKLAISFRFRDLILKTCRQVYVFDQNLKKKPATCNTHRISAQHLANLLQIFSHNNVDSNEEPSGSDWGMSRSGSVSSKSSRSWGPWKDWKAETALLPLGPVSPETHHSVNHCVRGVNSVLPLNLGGIQVYRRTRPQIPPGLAILKNSQQHLVHP